MGVKALNASVVEIEVDVAAIPAGKKMVKVNVDDLKRTNARLQARVDEATTEMKANQEKIDAAQPALDEYAKANPVKVKP